MKLWIKFEYELSWTGGDEDGKAKRGEREKI